MERRLNENMPAAGLKSRLDLKSAFVGLGGTHTTVQVVRQPDRIVWRLSPWTYGLVVLALALVGPGLLTLLWLRPSGTADVTKMPVFMAAWIVALPLICCALLVHYLFYHPRVEFLRGTGELLFYKRGRTPCLRLRRAEIKDFKIDSEWFRTSESAPVKNYVLSAVCEDGREIGLCKTSDEKLLRELSGDISGMG